MIGAGTAADPKRPLYAPLPSQMRPGSRDGIVAFTYELSDDGKSALVEFAARDRKGLLPILNDRRPDLKAFEKGKAKYADIERELQKHKKGFKLDRFGVRVP